MLTCDSCSVLACKNHKLDEMPANCPMRDGEAYPDLMQEYNKEENHEFFVNCALVEQKWN